VTAERVEAAFEQYRKDFLPRLEKQYVLSDAEATELAENPAQAFPKLAAKVHYHAQIAAYTGIMSQMPGMISHLLEQTRTYERNENAFFDRWPALKDKAHATVVDQTLRAFRQANPSISTEDMIEKAGVMAMLAAGLDPRPPVADPTAVPVITPARPAGTGGMGAPRPAAAGATNVFEEMYEADRADG
jgi:hypothetical protein